MWRTSPGGASAMNEDTMVALFDMIGGYSKAVVKLVAFQM